jgi:hypothetical protein
VTNQMRNLFSMATGGIVLFVVIALSSCASADGGGTNNGHRPPSNSGGGITIGPATVAPGTTEFESPWPFGPLGMDD